LIAEAELELAMSKLKLNNKKNPQKIIKEIASCEVKYGIPVSNSKEVAQLIRLGGKEYGTVITVTQMCKKTEGVTCTSMHIVDEMWKQWRVKGGKECGEENSDDEEETSLAKTAAKSRGKKEGDKDKETDPMKKETRMCNHCQKKGHIEDNCWQKDPSKMPEKFKKKKDAKTEKAGAVVEEEHLLSFVDMDIEDKDVEYKYDNDKGIKCFNMNEAFYKVPIIDNIVYLQNEACVQVELGLEEEDVENEDEPNDASQIRPTLQALNSPNLWIGDTGATKHSTKHRQGGINARPSSSRTRGIYGQVIKPDSEVDLPGIYCDKETSISQ